jgi:cytoskeletal protein RodZ
MLSPLKQARLDSGKTIEQISSDLSIRKQYLLALEEGNFKSLPEVYAKGYLKLYANYLGVVNPSEEEDKNIPKEIILQHKFESFMIKHKWKRHFISISILMLIILPIIYHLILQS